MFSGNPAAWPPEAVGWSHLQTESRWVCIRVRKCWGQLCWGSTVMESQTPSPTQCDPGLARKLNSQEIEETEIEEQHGKNMVWTIDSKHKIKMVPKSFLKVFLILSETLKKVSKLWIILKKCSWAFWMRKYFYFFTQVDYSWSLKCKINILQYTNNGGFSVIPIHWIFL